MKEHLFTIQKQDFTIQTFKCGRSGGQHANKTLDNITIII